MGITCKSKCGQTISERLKDQQASYTITIIIKTCILNTLSPTTFEAKKSQPLSDQPFITGHINNYNTFNYKWTKITANRIHNVFNNQ